MMTSRLNMADAGGSAAGVAVPADGVPIYSAGSPDVPMTRFTRNGVEFINAVIDADVQAGSLTMTLNRLLPTVGFVTSSSGGTTSCNAAWPPAGTYRLIFEGTLATGKTFRKDWDFVAT